MRAQAKVLAMLRLYTRAVLFPTLLMGAASASEQTPTWSAYATISATTTLQPNRICYSDGRDIICDTSAPTLGGVGATDRITSGTQARQPNQPACASRIMLSYCANAASPS